MSLSFVFFLVKVKDASELFVSLSEYLLNYFECLEPRKFLLCGPEMIVVWIMISRAGLISSLLVLIRRLMIFVAFERVLMKHFNVIVHW